ncbi:DUF2867 domain-containing protein [Donghicola tyrosinivorans]|uniref:Uncharacterized protein DUF2867 n=1 Tax=Donghicola tyrosinivorans TaxID=1652492 RepID=A0A2T0X0F6_9RHOB|nr:DUF2867 domain-containing protein [Donghicola tyrosinivorans]PRY92428.1 uncharacterized protein DUF2867 [Donghicola tyrosinivorans]
MTALPPNAQLLAPAAKLDYFDVRSAPLPHPMTALEAWNLIMSRPLPLIRLAFKIRDAISGLFGVKKIGGFTGARQTSVATGDHLDFFLVEDITPDCLVLTERDRHLDVMTCIAVHDDRLFVISSVLTHNLFGKVYMLPVGPAHKLIVNAMLRRLDTGVKGASATH